jgi:hypothetical protein
MRLIPTSILFLLFITFFSACSEEKKERSLNEKFTSYSNQNESVIFSGKIYLNNILENADYQHIPKINKLISSELESFKQGIYIDSGVYFSVEGLLQSNGKPSKMHLFATLKNKDSIHTKIASLGLLLEHSKNLDYAIGPNFSIGIQDDIVLLQYQEKGSITVNDFNKLFQELNKKSISISDRIQNEKSSAIQITTHLEHIYQLYNKNLGVKLGEIKQKEIKTLLNDASLSTTLKFESGGITIDTKHNFSAALKNRLFFNESSINTLSKLAPGKATAGISTHIYPLKVQTLLEDFSPDFFQQVASMHGNIALGMMALGNRPITNLFGGQLAFMYFGASDSRSFYLTLGDKGKSISDLTRSFFDTNPLYTLNIREKEISAISKNHVSKIQRLSLPNFAKDFGTHGIDCFMDITDYTSTQPSFLEEYPFLEAISWVKVSVSNEGSTIRIQGKDAEIGILKQITNVYLNKIRDAISLY